MLVAMPAPALANTAFVILGLLDAEPRTGYEIKAVVDNSTRFFWAASYGQIYPELRKLREAGLIESERDPASARKRVVHRLTPPGRKALRDWLAEPAAPTEYRDEKLLKLFFSGSAGDAGQAADSAAAALAARAAEHAEVAARLRELEPIVVAGGDPHKLAVLRYGIALNEWGLDHCERAARELRPEPKEDA